MSDRITLRWRGSWEADTRYYAGDVVTDGITLYAARPADIPLSVDYISAQPPATGWEQLFAVADVGSLSLAHSDGTDSITLDGTTLRIARQDNAGTERTVVELSNDALVVEKSNSNGASVARIQANEATTSISHFDPVDSNAYAEIDLSEAGSVNIIRSHGAAIDYITLEGNVVTLVRQDVTGQAVAVVTLDDTGPGEGRITAAVPSGTVGSNQAIVDKSRVALVTQDPDDGSDKATVNLGVNGSVAVVTTGTFTYNGDEVATV